MGKAKTLTIQPDRTCPHGDGNCTHSRAQRDWCKNKKRGANAKANGGKSNKK